MEPTFLQLIESHGSCRHYRPDPLPAATVEVVVGAAQRSSTSSNLQAYSVIAVTDSAKRAELAQLCGDQKHVAEAPVFLAWCADLARLERVAEIRGLKQESAYVESFLTAAMDAAIAAQTAALAAESLGLGICYIGGLRNQPRQVLDLLKVPRLVFPLFGMTLGWPQKAPRPRPRLPQSAILHWESYNPQQDSALQVYDREMAATGVYQNRQVAAPDRPDEMENYGWLEHSARRVSQPTRVFLREILREQGFFLE